MGVIESMISSVRDNRRLRGEQKTMRDRSDDYSYEQSSPLEFKNSMSEAEHAQHKISWKRRKRASQIRLAVFLMSIVLIIVTWLVWLGM